MQFKSTTIVLSGGEEVTIKQPENFETMYDITRNIVQAIFEHYLTKERNISRAHTKTAGECGYSDPSAVRRIIGVANDNT